MGQRVVSELTTGAEDGARWDHPYPAVCDGTCVPEEGAREVWHHREPVTTTLERYRDVVSGGAFRDDDISGAGIQTPGEVGWRLQVNSEVVETSLEDMERVLVDQLTRLREVIDALRVRGRRSA